MTKEWTDAEIQWLEANHERMDIQTLSHGLTTPLADVEKKILELRAARLLKPKAKAPASVKEAVNDFSAAQKEYREAIEVFRQRDLERAAKLFRELMERHPFEKEILDRSRMYLNACRNGQSGDGEMPKSAEELYRTAVFEKNRGNPGRALELLRSATDGGDTDGRLHYLAACCHALSGHTDQALSHLQNAIARNRVHRIQARIESDLASLRGRQRFSELVAGA